jgi:hypothetical protein
VAGPRPIPAFSRVALDLADIAAGERFGRIYPQRYPDPLGYAKTPSRFSDPRRRIERNRFGVLYLGASLNVCFIETILRDLRNGVIGDFPIDESELRTRHYAEIQVVDPLRLVDLRGNGRIRMGVPSDVAGGSRQTLARWWSLAFYTHSAMTDGIIYPSRLNGETNLAIYDRAVTKLTVARTTELINAPGLPRVLNDLNVALV